MSDIREFVNLILHGDDEHRQWLIDAGYAYRAGEPIPKPRGKGKKTMDAEQLEFVRDVLDDTLISGEVNGDRILQALEIVADELQETGDNNDGDSNEVQSTGNGPFDDLETSVEPVQENNDSPDQSAS